MKPHHSFYISCTYICLFIFCQNLLVYGTLIILSLSSSLSAHNRHRLFIHMGNLRVFLWFMPVYAENWFRGCQSIMGMVTREITCYTLLCNVKEYYFVQHKHQDYQRVSSQRSLRSCNSSMWRRQSPLYVYPQDTLQLCVLRL